MTWILLDILCRLVGQLTTPQQAEIALEFLQHLPSGDLQHLGPAIRDMYLRITGKVAPI